MNFKKNFTKLPSLATTLVYVGLTLVSILALGLLFSTPNKKIPVKVKAAQCTEVIFEATQKSSLGILSGDPSVILDSSTLGAVMLASETRYKYLCSFTYQDSNHRIRTYEDFPADRIIEPGMVVMIREK